ncbi:MAG TPA: ion transporter [Desulfobulbus sp.]|nr:ion transporter [Desulfobulbus sp.]
MTGNAQSRVESMRRYVFALLNRGPAASGCGQACRIFMVAIIFTSAMALVLTTEPGIMRRYGPVLFAIETAASLIFMAEYLLRLWSCPERPAAASAWRCRIRYLRSFMGLVDLLSFLPFLLVLSGFAESPGLMLLQLTRLFKLTRYSPAFVLLADVLRDEMESLLVSVMLMFVIFIFASVGIYIFEHDMQPRAFGSIPMAMWWAIVTLTTVGYGDVTPITVQGRIFATLITVVGVGLVSLPAGIIASGFTEQLRMRRERFQSEVEQLIREDGVLSREDISHLEQDRQELGINRDKADLIISQVQREQRLTRQRRKETGNDPENSRREDHAGDR